MSEKNEQYAAPVVKAYGSVEEMTAGKNKIGSITDKFTPSTGIIGKIVKI